MVAGADGTAVGIRLTPVDSYTAETVEGFARRCAPGSLMPGDWPVRDARKA